MPGGALGLTGRLMKSLFALGALALLVTPLGLAAPLYDQLQNGSFEEGLDAWTVEVGDVVLSTAASDGNFSAQLRAKPNELGGHYSILAQTIPQSQTDVPIVPGAYYDLSFDAKATYNDKGVGRANVTWTGINGAVLRVDVFNVTASAEFVSYSARLQAPIDPLAPDAAIGATLRFRVDGQSSDQGVNLWVDNAEFGIGTPELGL